MFTGYINRRNDFATALQNHLNLMPLRGRPDLIERVKDNVRTKFKELRCLKTVPAKKCTSNNKNSWLFSVRGISLISTSLFGSSIWIDWSAPPPLFYSPYRNSIIAVIWATDNPLPLRGIHCPIKHDFQWLMTWLKPRRLCYWAICKNWRMETVILILMEVRLTVPDLDDLVPGG